jgi:hypothetical protein
MHKVQDTYASNKHEKKRPTRIPMNLIYVPPGHVSHHYRKNGIAVSLALCCVPKNAEHGK